MKYDVIIIGSGAAGLVCAIEAGKRGRSVLLLDHSERVGNKIRISGGGRCNFTNINMEADKYLSANPHFVKSALARFTPHDFISMLEASHIQYHEKEEGQLFCKGSSADIVAMLIDRCNDIGSSLILNCRILRIYKGDDFNITTDKGTFRGTSLVVATGGQSYPSLGASGFGYRIARQFGLEVTELKPGLVPLTLKHKDCQTLSGLSGISVNAAVSCRSISFRGNVLVTHTGLSGPAVLQISSYWKSGEKIVIDPLPDTDLCGLLLANRTKKSEMRNFLSGLLPRRFAETWSAAYISSKPINQYTEKELIDISSKLKNWTLIPETTMGYEKAEVTVGGVDTKELSSKTMEAKKVRGLFFAGEVIDVTGHLGGYNLHWAWASGYTAGQYA